MNSNESFGFGPYIGACADTAGYQIVGACSDQLSSSQIKRARKGERFIKKTKFKRPHIPKESFHAYCSMRDLHEQEMVQQTSQETKEPAQEQKPKLWSGKKKEILQYWKSLPGVIDNKDTPIVMNPIPYKYQGSTFNQDGIRLTGSPSFINSVLPKLKDVIAYEGPNSKLSLNYKETTPEEDMKLGNRSFAFYIKTRERGPKAKAKYYGKI